MFKSIGNFLANTANYLDKSKNKSTNTTNTTDSVNTNNNTVRQATNTATNSDFETVNVDINSRNTQEVDTGSSSSQTEEQIITLLADAAEDLPKPDNNEIDFENEAEHITIEDAKFQEPVEPKTEYYSKALNLVSGIIDTSKLFEVIKQGYNVVAGSNLNDINDLINCFNNNTDLSEALLNRLGKLDDTEFYKLLTSQITAKNPEVAYYNTFTEYLFNIQIYIELQFAKYPDSNNSKLITKIENIIKRFINEIFKQIKQDNNITEKTLESESINREDVHQYNYTKVKHQFIADLDRYNNNFQLRKEQEILWDSRELKGDYQKILDDSATHIEKEQLKEQIFNRCHEEILEYVTQNNFKNKQEITNAIIIEQTQSGIALAYSIVEALQTSIFNDLLPENSKYMPLISQNYTKSDSVINVSEGNVIISTSYTFNQGISLCKSSNREEVINSGAITVSYDLYINPEDTTKSEYKNIKISFSNTEDD